MTEEALEVLEERINKAIDMIAALKAEREGLVNENRELNEQVTMLNARVAAAEEWQTRHAGLEEENRQHRASREEVRRRLTEIIAKLEKFQQ